MSRILLAAVFFFLPYSASANLACSPVDGSSDFTVQRCGNINLVRLYGSPEKRARVFGEVVRKNLNAGVLDYFSNKVSESLTAPAPLSGALNLLYDQFIRLWHRNVPSGYAEELNAYARGLGVDPIFLKRAVSLPDTASMLMGFDVSTSLPALGCTSVAAENDDGNFFYGRNLDFAGVNLWDKHPMILQIFPPEGSQELKHIVFGADGLLFGGITGVNEKGITISVHQNYSNDSSVSGIPMIFLGEMVLRSAETLDQALEILEKNRPSVLWTFVITDLQLGRAVAVETSTKRFSVRWMQSEGFVQTNHIMHPPFRSHEAMNLGTKLNSLFRMKTAFELLLKSSAISENTIAEILGYQENADGYFSAHHDILKAHTIQTLIFAPRLVDLGSLYISNEEAPASGGRFLRFSLDQLFLDVHPLNYSVEELQKIAPSKRERQKQISQAFHSYFDKKNLPEAISLLKSHPTISSVLFQTSAYYQLSQWKEAVQLAEQSLRESKYMDEPAYIRQSLKWLQLLSLLKLEKNREARDLAEALDTEIPLNPRLKALVKKVKAGKPPNPKDFSVAFEFFSGDLGTRPQ